jgi:hypothetical protein
MQKQNGPRSHLAERRINNLRTLVSAILSDPGTFQQPTNGDLTPPAAPMATRIEVKRESSGTVPGSETASPAKPRLPKPLRLLPQSPALAGLSRRLPALLEPDPEFSPRHDAQQTTEAHQS